MKFYWLVLWLILGCVGAASAQINPADTASNDTTRIDIIHIRQMHGFRAPEGDVIQMSGDVQMRQRNTYFWCDTSYMYPQRRIMAHGNVQINQNDSIDVFADSLFYDGLARTAQLKQEVILQDSTATIFTDLLLYDLNTRIATYPEGVLIVSDSNQLISKRGYYDANTNTAFFYDSVRAINPDFKLVTDSLSFNTETEVATFLSKTLIYDEDRFIYAEKGFYDARKQQGVFAQNAYYLNRNGGKSEKATGDSIIYDGTKKMYYLVGDATFNDGEQEVKADSIYYDEALGQYFFRGNPVFRSLDSTQTQQIQAGNSYYDKASGSMIFTEKVRVTDKSQVITSDSLQYNKEKRLAFAKGNVVLTDTVEKVQLNAGYVYYNDSTQQILAYDNPIAYYLIELDTMWLAADTLRSVVDSTQADSTQKDKSKSIRHMHAYHNARIFKSDLQALADSMFYNGRDSVFTLFTRPIMWADSVQFTADTIHFNMKNKALQQIFLSKNALIVHCNDETFYDQIKGRDVYAHFDSNRVYKVDVLSSGEAVYYIKDSENKYMGVNRVECGNMFIYFNKNEIRRIHFVDKPVAAMTNMGKTDHANLRLKNFKWYEPIRPKSKWDIIHPKKAELK